MKRKEVIICVFALIILIISLTEVLAANAGRVSNVDPIPLNTTISPPKNLDSLNELDDIDDSSDDVITPPGTTNPGTTNPGTTNPGTTNPGTTNPGTTNPGTTLKPVNDTNSNSNIPNTGIADTPIIAVGICVISAIIAYTQIRRYKY